MASPRYKTNLTGQDPDIVTLQPGLHHDRQLLLDILLQVSEASKDKLESCLARKASGSCEWLSQKADFRTWLTSGQPGTFWIWGPPASGKSVLASYVVEQLRSLKRKHSFYFFDESDTTQSGISHFLRSMAWQMSCLYPEVFEVVLRTCMDNDRLCISSYHQIWQKLFVQGILNIKVSRPHVWVIDALDECTEVMALLATLGTTAATDNLCILITSRDAYDISDGYDESSRNSGMHQEEIDVEDTKSDIRLFLRASSMILPVSGADGEQLMDDIVIRSEGNFLWTRLILDELINAVTISDIQEILDGIPVGMSRFYERLTHPISQQVPALKQLSIALLTWTVCGARPLTLRELYYALELNKESGVVDVKKFIWKSCGHLLKVDKHSPYHVQAIHPSTHKYLLQPDTTKEITINNAQGHLSIATACLNFLCGRHMSQDGLRNRKRSQSLDSLNSREIATYACTSFHIHIAQVSTEDEVLLPLLVKFLSLSNVLVWIEYVARYGELHVLTDTAESLNQYVQRRLKYRLPFDKGIDMIESYVADLSHLVAKFGRTLKHSPSSIYSLILPYFPSERPIRQTFAVTAQGLSIVGLSSVGWDDCLATLSYRRRDISDLATSHDQFAVALNEGKIVIYNATTCQEIRLLLHGEAINKVTYGAGGKYLASAGSKVIRIWEAQTGNELRTIDTPGKCMCLSLKEMPEFLWFVMKECIFIPWNLTIEESMQPSLHHTPFVERTRGLNPYDPEPILVYLYPWNNLLVAVPSGQDIELWDVQNAEIDSVLHRDDLLQRRGGCHLIALASKLNYDLARLFASYSDDKLLAFDIRRGNVIATASVRADIIAVSPRENFVGVAANSGAIKLFHYETLTLLYSINVWGGPTRSLIFSWDESCLLDARGTQCRVWKPSMLATTRQDTDSESWSTDGIYDDVEVDEIAPLVAITSLLCLRDQDVILCGKEDGHVVEYDTQQGQQQSKPISISKGDWSVVSLTYDEESRILVTCYSSNVIVAQELVFRRNKFETPVAIFDHNPGCEVVQVLLQGRERRLLLSTLSDTRLFDLSSPEQHPITIMASSGEVGRRYATHPLHRDQIIMIQGNVARIYNWLNLMELTEPEGIILEGSALPRQSTRTISSAFTNASLAITCSEGITSYARKRLLIFKSDNFCPSSTRVAPDPAYHLLTDQAELVIGIYKARLLFLHGNGWVCSTVPETGNRSFVRHFAVPAEWMLLSSEILVQVRYNGDVVFVRGHEIAIIKNGLDVTSL